ncbi:uncharacterized protein LOC114426419 [Parambassis ranga]|uniref:Uncharacterized protein LOC114426419 n=1 Tax=Parambassis ranga TaxID=210632 RepID=A0A6P7HM16_9TELE|nr:uncharacterized protein LOC114426419 [Parambassis ranga]
MNTCNFNLFFILTVRFIFYQSHGFHVIQPQNRTINPDNSVTISCEHDSTAPDSSVVDVRLYRINPNGQKFIIYQKGMKNSKNILMYSENSNKFIFIMLNNVPEAINATYECEITVQENEIDYTNRGKPTQLLHGEKKTEERCHPPPSFPPPRPQPPLLRWILIGLLALMFLYSTFITCFYIRLVMNINNDCEDSTYVEMRKTPVPRSQHYEIHAAYCS